MLRSTHPEPVMNRYRKEEQEQPSRLDRLLEARLVIEAAVQAGHKGEEIHAMLQAEYQRRGGDEIDSQMEAMLLVLEEGKIYRRAALLHATQMQEFGEGKRILTPPPL